MVNTIDMQDMRHINLFERITNITTRFCFSYNENIIFCVPRKLISKAVGDRGKNVKKLGEILRKRIKIISAPNGIEDARTFFEDVVSPTTFKEIEIKDDDIIITAGSQSKAALIGRNRRRLLELQKISEDFFGKDLRII
ncbi:MAG: hypothetical protein WC584_03180 [Candidatus Pacearchaeota archaeon]